MFQTEVLSELKGITKEIISEVKHLDQHTEQELNKKPKQDAWSALECIEHLKRYADFYHPLFKNALDNAQQSKSNMLKAKYGWFGNFMVNLVKPSAGIKMKTFADKNPLGSQVDRAVLSEFKKQQEELLALLEKAETADLNKTKVHTTLGKWHKMKMTDALRFVIYHNQRHLQQAKRALAS